MFYQIAIDGYSGVGKSTLAKLVAEKLSFVNVNTGLFYRALAFFYTKNTFDNYFDFIKQIKESKEIIFKPTEIIYKGKKINSDLFTEEIAKESSKIAKEKIIRDFVLSLTREISKTNNVVVEGRDIGTIVFPFATIKFFLNATAETRAKRRYLQIKNKNSITIEEIKKEIIDRDAKDSNRDIAPLKKSDDAYEIYTDNLTIDEIVEKICNKFKSKI